MSDATLPILRTLAAEGPVAVVAVARTLGSAPRESGTFMAVTAEKTVGTIGGGQSEYRAIEAARELLATGISQSSLDIALGPEIDQCCGGRMLITIVRLEGPPSDTLDLGDGLVLRERSGVPVMLYGAGHVGVALARALKDLPFDLTWIDARRAEENPTPDDIPCRRLAIPEAAVSEAPDDAAHLIMTHSHALDLEIVAAVLSRKHKFCGLIGSATKRATFARRLRERGISADGLVCPIGLPSITGKAPAVIAASVAAQLLSLAPAPEKGT
ncbi:MAG: xanthine dehydrogenase accessory protein XdhC [Pseudomonadota bacterium]